MTQQKRLSKENYLMDIAEAVAVRATCPDLKVGTVIATLDGHILSTGYNGVAKNELHCKIKNGKCLENDSNHRVVHSEVNAICQAARFGIKLDGCIAYITHEPCIKCKAILKQAGIIKLIIKK